MDTVRYRPGWRQLPWLNPAVALWVFWVDGAPPAVIAALTAAMLLVLWRVRQSGVTLAPDALRAHGAFGTQAVPWPQVADVESRRHRGCHGVDVRTTAGRRLRLRAPVHVAVLAPDPDYVVKVETITRYWRAHVAPPVASPAT